MGACLKYLQLQLISLRIVGLQMNFLLQTNLVGRSLDAGQPRRARGTLAEGTLARRSGTRALSYELFN